MTRGHFVPLSVAYYDDDRVLDAGPIAEVLYVRSLALAGRLWESDGFLSRRQIDRLSADLPRDPDPTVELVRVGLWRPDDSDPYRPGFRIRSWLDWNRSAAEILRGREKDAARKRTSRSPDVQKDAENGSGSRPGGVHTDAPVVSAGFHAPEAEAVAVSEAQAAAAAEVPPRPLTLDDEQALQSLAQACGRAGLVVSWRLDDPEAIEVAELAASRGVKALVDYAKRRHNPNDPAFSVRAWLDGWRSLPSLRLVEPARDCGLHPSAGRRPDGECAACRVDRLVEAREEVSS